MSLPNVIQGDVQVGGTLSASHFDLSAGDVKNANFSSAISDRLDAAKAIHHFPVRHAQKEGTDAVSETIRLHTAKGSGILASFQVVAAVVPAGTGCDKQVTLDFQKWNGSTWSSLLTAAITIDSSKAANTVYTATLIATPTYLAGELLRQVWTASGSVGSQAQGICAVAMVQEQPS